MISWVLQGMHQKMTSKRLTKSTPSKCILIKIGLHKQTKLSRKWVLLMPASPIHKNEKFMTKQVRSQETCNHPEGAVEAAFVIANSNKKLIPMRYLECSLEAVCLSIQIDAGKLIRDNKMGNSEVIIIITNKMTQWWCFDNFCHYYSFFSWAF